MTDEETKAWLRQLFGDEPPEPEAEPTKNDDDADMRQFVGELFDQANQD